MATTPYCAGPLYTTAVAEIADRRTTLCNRCLEFKTCGYDLLELSRGSARVGSNLPRPPGRPGARRSVRTSASDREKSPGHSERQRTASAAPSLQAELP